MASFYFWLKYDPSMTMDSGVARAQAQLDRAGDNSTTGGTIRNDNPVLGGTIRNDDSLLGGTIRNQDSGAGGLFGGTIRNRAQVKSGGTTLAFEVTGVSKPIGPGGFTFYGESATEARMWASEADARKFADDDAGRAFSTWLGNHRALLAVLEIS
jgi:hypothetical protein